jgi:hypothetical protein
LPQRANCTKKHTLVADGVFRVMVPGQGRWIIFLDDPYLLSRLLYNFVNKKKLSILHYCSIIYVGIVQI